MNPDSERRMVLANRELIRKRRSDRRFYNTTVVLCFAPFALMPFVVLIIDGINTSSFVLAAMPAIIVWPSLPMIFKYVLARSKVDDGAKWFPAT